MPVDLSAKIRDIPDFPKRGIVFKDIMPLLADADALHETVERLAEFAEPRKPDLILGAEARGFILGAALAYRPAEQLRGSERGNRAEDRQDEDEDVQARSSPC